MFNIPLEASTLLSHRFNTSEKLNFTHLVQTLPLIKHFERTRERMVENEKERDRERDREREKEKERKKRERERERKRVR